MRRKMAPGAGRQLFRSRSIRRRSRQKKIVASRCREILVTHSRRPRTHRQPRFTRAKIRTSRAMSLIRSARRTLDMDFCTGPQSGDLRQGNASALWDFLMTTR
jgi:hypothetical protein